MIDFAKAPAGMTHYDTQTERFCFVNGSSFFYDEDSGSDRPGGLSPFCKVGSTYEHRYIKKIPVREIKLNEYADGNDKLFRLIVGAYRITQENIDERRARRIEYGFMSPEGADIAAATVVDDEWLGGLPQIGCKCEARSKKSGAQWRKYEVWVCKEGWIAGRCIDSEIRFAIEPELLWHEDYEFRPIETEEQNKRAVAVNYVLESLGDGVKSESDRELIETLMANGLIDEEACYAEATKELRRNGEIITNSLIKSSLSGNICNADNE